MVAVLSDNRLLDSTPSGLVAAARLRAPARVPLHPSVYRRRRLMAAGLLLLAIAAVLVLAQSIAAGTGGGPLTTTGAAAGAGGMSPAGAQVYVVRSGDTLWSIARTLDPKGDVRPLVDRLDAEIRGASIYPGETIAIPAGPGLR